MQDDVIIPNLTNPLYVSGHQKTLVDSRSPLQLVWLPWLMLRSLRVIFKRTGFLRSRAAPTKGVPSHLPGLIDYR